MASRSAGPPPASITTRIGPRSHTTSSHSVTAQRAAETPPFHGRRLATLQLVLTDTQAPRIAVDPDGSAWAVWAQLDIASNSYSTYAAHSFNDQWGRPTLLDNGPGNTSLPKVVIDPFINPFDVGYALAVWTQHDGRHSSIYSSHFQSLFGTWNPPVLVEQTDSEAFDVEIADGQSGIPSPCGDSRTVCLPGP